MNKLHIRWLVAAAVIILAPAGVLADELVTNRFTFSGRFGLNIRAKFQDVGSALPVPRKTLDRDNYNYDDGYVLTDRSGNYLGQTTYWGYDDSSRQIAGNTIVLSRSVATVNSPVASADADPGYGAELAYDRQLGVKGNVRYGLEGAANFLDISLRNSSTFASSLRRTTDAFPFTPGTTPPLATPANPFQGRFDGRDFVIGATNVSSSTSVVPGPTVTTTRRLDSNLWGFRLGPYLEFPIGESLCVWVSGGLALGLLDSSVSWRETTALSGGPAVNSGSGHDNELLLGGYVGANVSWRFSEHWSAVGGAQYQNLGTYNHTFGSQRVQLDLSNSVFLMLGLGYSF